MSTAVGILITCAVSESVWFSLHASATCVTFGAGMLLAYIACRERAALLTAAGCVTGICQALKLAGWLHFPSVLLALGEGLIILGFGLTLAGPCSTARPQRRSAAARALAAPSVLSSRLSRHVDAGGGGARRSRRSISASKLRRACASCRLAISSVK